MCLRCKAGTHTPDPVHHLDLLVQLHHEDDEEDDGEDHLADGHGGVASVQRGSVADDDNEADDLTGMRGREKRELMFTRSCSENQPELSNQPENP